MAIPEHNDAKAQSISPVDGTLIETFDDHSPSEVERRLSAAQGGFDAWRRRSVEERADVVAALGAFLERHRDRLAAHITAEMGKTIKEATAEIDKCAATCRWYAEHGPAMLRDRVAPVDQGRAMVAQRPIGVILGVMPWNFPFWQVLRAAIPIILSGNGYVLKHARNVMRCAFELEVAWTESGLPSGVFTVVNVDQGMTAKILADARIAAVTLTGSARAGAAVASLAGANLKKSVLELGGSDPFVVLEGADLKKAAAAGAKARFQNAGQVCIAAKRFIVEASIADAFTEHLIDATRALNVGDPTVSSTDLGPMARRDLRTELQGQIERSIAAGARPLLGGHEVEGAGNFHEPTILAGVLPGMAAFDEETFGPCAAITEARDTDHAIALANLSSYGLSASLWTEDSSTGAAFADRFECGGVFLNGFPTSDPRIPIGGVKQSGYGRELSHYGITEFVNAQTVWRDRP
ncbi:NAD-dependent succinate-semialdehyde dehydrogenase [Methylobacterium gnaphalii]|uniref:Succinate-semialdehyde dehydrogenase n=1 Tax=Methylobacterium gnaphalii TaxID=1010610 RepID=A0A512JPY7_9HYPH|nr:NAD-dependent succinate-semialdehyde dehydrogenase [Methylobacterium gnaphalii]GEP12026.1 succinate-semialdehyde dehydrogenase [Methylobacterium gnaphalii]GJD71606.1 Succinate semialdehyde dehydrogenase [NAD(P)+] Sad [Methylobacterium gnaphalii]GLS51237.1 succinate-semialdehyde dehydrogenase [Methylobacterium gnaphalii]